MYQLGNGQWNIPNLRTLLEEVLPKKKSFKDFEVTREFEKIGRRTMLLSGRQVSHLQRILLFIEDITERRQTQATIEVSEIRYRRLFEAARDGILILDPRTRKITDANPFMSELLGYPRQELLGKELWEIGLLRDEKANQSAFRELQKKHFIRYEDLPLQNKTGQRREVEFVSNLYDEDGRNVIQCIFLLQHALKKVGVANPIQVAGDGQQAIDYLQGAGKFADRTEFPFPCLVLLDLKLPFVMGLDVLRWIRQQPGTVLTVLMLTASGSEADIVEAYRLGANAFLTKPSEASRLEEMVRAIKDFWLTHNTLPQASSPESQLGGDLWRVISAKGSVAPSRLRVNGVARSKRRYHAKGTL